MLGIPLQLSEMGLLKVPACGFAVTVKFPDFPDGIVTVAGAALKSIGGAELLVPVALQLGL